MPTSADPLRKNGKSEIVAVATGVADLQAVASGSENGTIGQVGEGTGYGGGGGVIDDLKHRTRREHTSTVHRKEEG